MQMRLDARPQAAVARRQTVEHVFGTLKAWLGTTPLLTKTLPKVKTKVSLAVLAYKLQLELHETLCCVAYSNWPHRHRKHIADEIFTQPRS
jgi:hypothetical protein